MHEEGGNFVPGHKSRFIWAVRLELAEQGVWGWMGVVTKPIPLLLGSLEPRPRHFLESRRQERKQANRVGVEVGEDDKRQ